MIPGRRPDRRLSLNSSVAWQVRLYQDYLLIERCGFVEDTSDLGAWV